MTRTESVDLLQFVASVATKLPQTDDDRPFRFMPDTLSDLPDALDTDQLIIQRAFHDYWTWRIDYPQVFGRKPVYEALGVVTAAVLLHPERKNLRIRLENPRSEVRELRIERLKHPKDDNGFAVGLRQIPTEFVYYPDQARSKPWLHESVPDPEAYPRVLLTTNDDLPITEDDWKNRDILSGFGSDEGTARLIQLFLDISRETNQVPEFVLESEAGFRGVAPASAEIRFWLPGGDVPDSEFP